MRNIKLIAVFLFGTLVLGACAANESGRATDGDYADTPYSASNTNSAPSSAPVENAQVAEKSADDGTRGGETEDQVSLNEAEKSQAEKPAEVMTRKIIRNADLTLEAEKPDEAQRKITAVAEGKKGFVITSTQRNTNEKLSGSNSVSMQIRVPSDKFQESLEEIRKTADRVIVESVTGQDVTEEFVDIEARLKTKKALEARFLEIMQQAKSVTEALEVERQLANVRTEIERIEGRKRFLESQTSLSTINVEIRTPVAITSSSTGFFYELKQAVSDGFEAALTFILVLIRILIALIPFLVLVVLPVLLVLRYFWRKYKKKRAARKFVEEELREDNIIDVE
jgi:hypothetical protein